MNNYDFRRRVEDVADEAALLFGITMLAVGLTWVWSPWALVIVGAFVLIDYVSR